MMISLGVWDAMPREAMVELTNACNMQCVTCAHEKVKRKIGFMSPDIFDLILDRCSESKITNLRLYTVGESLLHPLFSQILDKAMSSGLKQVWLSTNGMLLNNELINILINSGVNIQFSFGGWNKESYDMIYKGGSFDVALSHLKNLNDRLKEKGIQNKLVVNSLVSPNLKLGAQQTRAFLMSLGFNQGQIRIAYPGTNGGHFIGQLKQQRILERFLRRLKGDYCSVLNNRIGIQYDGQVTACGCADYDGELIIGDIRKQSLDEIRVDRPYQKIVLAFRSGNLEKVPMCFRCKMRLPAVIPNMDNQEQHFSMPQ